MKRKMIALPLALSSLLILGACGDDEDMEIQDIEVNDPMLEDDGENDTGIENEANNEEEKIEDVEENEEPETQDEGSVNDSVDDAND